MSDFNIQSNNTLDYKRGFTLEFNPLNGFSDTAQTSKRLLSRIKSIFADSAAANEHLEKDGDTLVYEFHELGVPEHPGDLSFGMSIVYPGKIGNEYFMTKGHFHTIIDTAEVYYCLSGHGYMMLEDPEGDWRCLELLPGKTVYCPKRYAHRSINVSTNEALRTFFVYRSDAGHDYGTIETKGFRNILVEKDGNPIVIKNPNWK